MSKKEIKAALALYGYKIIKPSWRHDKMAKCVLFNAYDDYGECHMFYMDYGMHYARRTMLSDLDIKMKSVDVAFIFWEDSNVPTV